MYHKKVGDKKPKEINGEDAAKELLRQEVIKKLGLTPEQIKHFADKNKDKPKPYNNTGGVRSKGPVKRQ